MSPAICSTPAATSRLGSVALHRSISTRKMWPTGVAKGQALRAPRPRVQPAPRVLPARPVLRPRRVQRAPRLRVLRVLRVLRAQRVLRVRRRAEAVVVVPRRVDEPEDAPAG